MAAIFSDKKEKIGDRIIIVKYPLNVRNKKRKNILENIHNEMEITLEIIPPFKTLAPKILMIKESA